MADEPEFPQFLRLAAVPMIVRDKITNTKTWYVKELDYQLLDIFSTALGFRKYAVVPSLDGEYGSLLENNSFTGVVGLLERGEADMVISALGITEQRQQAAHFSFPYYIDDFVFATKKPDFAPKFLTIIYPFSTYMWISIFVCLLLMSMVFYIMFRLLRRGRTYEEVLLKTFGSFLHQNSVFEPVRLSGRILLLSWIFGTLFITFSYTAVFLSFLTLPVRERGIRSIPELSVAVDEGRYQVSTYKGNYIPEVLRRADEGYLRLLGEKVKKDVLVTETDSAVLQSGTKSALIVPRSYVSFLRKRCFISEENFFLLLTAIAYRKDFCCPRAIERVIHRVVAAGLHKKIIEDQDFKAELKLPPEEPEPEVDALSIVDMSGPFIFLMIGYILSSLAFIVEVCIGKVKKKLSRGN